MNRETFPQDVIVGWWVSCGTVKHWPSDKDVEFRVARELGRTRVFACGTWWRWFPDWNIYGRYRFGRYNGRGEAF